jgi:hypothetical protein
MPLCSRSVVETGAYRGDLDEDVFGVQSDLRVFSVDDGREREHYAIGILDHGVKRLALQNLQEWSQMRLALTMSQQVH